MTCYPPRSTIVPNCIALCQPVPETSVTKYLRTNKQTEQETVNDYNPQHACRHAGITTLITSYLVSYCVDSSSVAEQHRHQRQQVWDHKDRRSDCLLGNVAAVGAPRHTRSLDDVAAQTSHDCQIQWQQDPNEHDCAIHQSLLNVELQQSVVPLVNLSLSWDEL